MNKFMIIAIVPIGHAERVLQSANKTGATGGTVIRGRGATKAVKEGLFSLKIEPEEEIVLIIVPGEITETVCNRINEDFKGCSRCGCLYVLPVGCNQDTQSMDC